MTSTVVAPVRDRLSSWCGWLMVGAAVLAPLLAWLGPLAFAVLVAGVGLLALPAVRMTDEDRPGLVALFALLIWAAVSTTWSPYHPKHAEDGTIVKMAFELPLYWSAICAARRADPRLAKLALGVLAFGFTALGAVLLVEAATGAAVYRTLHIALYEPIRPDFAIRNVAQATFVMALLWPLAALGAPVKLRPWFAGFMVLSAGVAAHVFLSDAPVMAALLAPIVGLGVYRWPRGAPKAFAGVVVAFFLAMPALVWGVRALSNYTELENTIPLSWGERLGYWSHAVDWIADKPLQGWGLDASRMFGPGIVLHPHDAALQVWLELGAVGALSVAVFWGVTLPRLSRPAPSLAAAATAASTAVFLLFLAVNFGVWQEYWLALGALVPMLAALHGRAATSATPALLSTSAP
jgi:O-antigen ligase